MVVAVTIDFERLSHARAYRELTDTPEIELDIESITDRILNLFSETENLSTFFVVADIAESNPDLIRRIHDAGHEIGSHTYSHRILSNLSNEELELEIFQPKRILESVLNDDVIGFRAPELNHTPDSLSRVQQAGYEYDSSAINSISIPGFYSAWNELDTEAPHKINPDAGSFVEVPLSVNPYFKLPVSGAWIRILGRRYTRWTLRSLEQQGKTPVIYLHPREFQSIPRSSGLPPRIWLRSGDWTFNVLESILRHHETIPIRELVSGIH